MTQTPKSPAQKRDRRLDVFRGIALITIFVNHVPRTVYENFTSRNFGFSDAAEGFVLMSGIAAALAYSASFRAGDIVNGIDKMWKRAGRLYVVHLASVLIALMIVAFGARFMQSERLVDAINIAPIVEDPIGGLLGLGSLMHQPGYFNILPLYAVLLLAGPVFLMVGLRSKAALLALAVTIWAAAGTWRLNFPNYPNEGGWFFNPIAWQLIFVVGLLGGLAMKEGRKLVPYNPVLFGAACAFLAFSLVVTVLGLWGFTGDLGLPFFIHGYDKTFAALPRVLHVLALAYVLTNLHVVRRLASHRLADPLAVLGQNGLAVFASGSVICIVIQVVKNSFVLNAVQDGVLLALGLLAQYAIALYVSRGKKAGQPKPVAAPVRPTGVTVRPSPRPSIGVLAQTRLAGSRIAE
jgi:hypothetical protein